MKKQTNLFWKYKVPFFIIIALILTALWLFITSSSFFIFLIIVFSLIPLAILFFLVKKRALIKTHALSSGIGGICGLIIGFYPSFFNAGMIGIAGHSNKNAEFVVLFSFIIVLLTFIEVGILIGLGIGVLRKKWKK